MAQTDPLYLKLFLEAHGVNYPRRVCQQLHKHGVTTLTRFAELSVDTLYKWDIADYYVRCALPRAQQLLRSRLRYNLRQQLLVRARIH